ADPGRQIDVLAFVAQLDFCNDKTEVLPREDVDLPRQIAMGNLIARLLDDRAFPESNERFGLQGRYSVFQFEPAQLGRRGLHSERCSRVVAYSYPHGSLVALSQIGLSDVRTLGRELPPVIATHEEAAFDFETHCPSDHLMCSFGAQARARSTTPIHRRPIN